jgi:hypothetical protein
MRLLLVEMVFTLRQCTNLEFTAGIKPPVRRNASLELRKKSAREMNRKKKEGICPQRPWKS